MVSSIQMVNSPLKQDHNVQLLVSSGPTFQMPNFKKPRFWVIPDFKGWILDPHCIRTTANEWPAEQYTNRDLNNGQI